MPTARELARRAHSYRNFEPAEFVQAIEEGESLRDLREALNAIESARFTPLLEGLSAMFDRLDRDEQVTYTERNPGLVRWMSVYNRLEELRPYDEFYEMAGGLLDDPDWTPTPFESDDADDDVEDLLEEMMFRRRSYRNWAPAEFMRIGMNPDGDIREWDLTSGQVRELGLFTPESRERLQEEGAFPVEATGKEVMRGLIDRVEAARFEPVLRAGHKFFAPLDPDERRLFARRNPLLVMWISAWGFSQDLIWGEDQLFPTSDVDWPFVRDVGESGGNPDGNPDGDPIEDFIDQIRAIGAFTIDTSPGMQGSTLVEFRTPLPGDQPIRSSVSIRDGRVRGAFIRLGRLGVGEVPPPPEHPSNDPEMTQRLADAAIHADPPPGTSVYVHFGDTTNVPRPHVLLGAIPGEGSGELAEAFGSADRLVRDGDREPGVDEVADYLERLFPEVRREFFDDDPNVRLTHDDPEYREVVESELDRLGDLGLLDGLDVITDDPDIYEGEVLEGVHLGRYNPETRNLYISPDEVLGGDGLSTFRHELGHHRLRMENPGEAFEGGPGEDFWMETEWNRFAVEELLGLDWERNQDPLTLRQARNELFDRIGEAVNRTATFGPMEFVAEVFAERLAGEHHPDWVDDLYDRLNGLSTGLDSEESKRRGGNPDGNPDGDLNGEEPSVGELRDEIEDRLAELHEEGTSFDDIEIRLDELVDGPIAQMECATLRDRLLEAVDVGRDYPVDTFVEARFRTLWNRAVSRLVFAGRECITQQDQRQIERITDDVTPLLGDREGFDRLEDLEEAVRATFPD